MTDKFIEQVYITLQIKISLDIFNQDLERFLMETNARKLYRIYILTNKNQKYDNYYGFYLYLILCSEIERIY